MNGPWTKVPKPSESTTSGRPAVTSIHDDETARALGYAGGWVGGATLSGITALPIVAALGYRWYENGVYSVRFAKPVYDREEVRAVWEDSEPDLGDKRKLTFWIERRNGERTSFGWAAIGDTGQTPRPPWGRNPGRQAELADDLLPQMQVGDKLPSFECRMSKEQSIALLDQLEDWNWWCGMASPQGDHILSPMEIRGMLFLGERRDSPERQTTQTTRSRQLSPPIDAGFDVVVYRALFTDHTYHIESRLCEKWQSAHSVFWTSESGFDDENGRRVAVVRWKVAHLIEDLGAESSV